MEVLRVERLSVNTGRMNGKISVSSVIQNQSFYRLPELQDGSFPAGMKQDVFAEGAGSP